MSLRLFKWLRALILTKYSYSVRVGELSSHGSGSHTGTLNSYEVGEFESCIKAIEKCQEYLAPFLPPKRDKHKSVEQLMTRLHIFGAYPFIITNDPNCKFSTLDYYREMCQKLVRENGGSP